MAKKKQSEPLNLDSVPIGHGLRKLTPPLAAFCNALTGREGEQPDDGEGIALSENIVLARIGSGIGIRFSLCLFIGGRWSVAAMVPSYDPGIVALKDSMTRTEPSPETLAAKRRAAEQRAAREAEAEERRKAQAAAKARYEQDTALMREAWDREYRARIGGQAA